MSAQARLEARPLADVYTAARTSLTEYNMVRLSRAAQIAFVQSLSCPPQHNAALQKALSMHKQMVESR